MASSGMPGGEDLSMLEKTVLIDWFNEVKPELDPDFTVVAIDVIRATTTAVTAVALGRKCYPVSSLDEARLVAHDLKNPLMVGELGGNMPYGFDMQNSPTLVAGDRDTSRPIVLLSTSGTRLITEYRDQHELYVACLRNYRATAAYLAANAAKVALVGAGTRGEFREEDQLCAAWIANLLTQSGFKTANAETARVIERWKDEPAEIIRGGNSAAYLLRSDQSQDLEFVLNHVDDLQIICKYQDMQVVETSMISYSLDGKNKLNAK